MTRIIGGLVGSLKLASPAKATRPTSDRIRESIFNRLQARDLIDGASVLDLYAGTGALGLESLSRSANSVTLVEKDGKAAAVCIQNARLLETALKKQDIEARVRVAHHSVNQFLGASTEEFDLVFIDPPYEVSNEEVLENLTKLIPLLSPDAIVIVERSSRTEGIEVPAGLALEDSKNYGDTEVYWLNRA